MANPDTVVSDSDVRIANKTELDKITKELQGAFSSAAFMDATQGAEKRPDALDATVRDDFHEAGDGCVERIRSLLCTLSHAHECGGAKCSLQLFCYFVQLRFVNYPDIWVGHYGVGISHWILYSLGFDEPLLHPLWLFYLACGSQPCLSHYLDPLSGGASLLSLEVTLYLL